MVINVSERPTTQADLETLTKLLRDPTIVRIVTVLDITRLSVLELLEYGLTREDINQALINGVIEVDKEALRNVPVTAAEGLLVAGDTYFQQFLNSKVKLTKLGLYFLECIKGCETEQEILEKARDRFDSGTFMPPESPHRP